MMSHQANCPDHNLHSEKVRCAEYATRIMTGAHATHAIVAARVLSTASACAATYVTCWRINVDVVSAQSAP